MKKIIKLFGLILSFLFLVFMWYAFSPLFYNTQVNEDFPFELEEQEVPILSKTQNVSENITQKEELNPKPLFSGNFKDADSFHKVSGKALIYEFEDKKILRFEDFESTNGPDLKVYLATDTTAKNYISLGELKGNVGNQNYELGNIDLKKYSYILIWCEKFSVHFGTAKLE